MHQRGMRVAAVLSLLFSALSVVSAFESPRSEQQGVVDRADLVVKSVRLTDNGDNDGFADPHETVSLYVTLRNSSGADRTNLVVTVASTGPTVDCIPSPVVAFGSLLAGEEKEAAVPVVFHVANVARSDAFASLLATLEFQIAGDGFGGTVRPQRVTLDLDLDASGGVIPTTFSEGFEGAGFGTFTTMTLDTGMANLAASDGLRCQYSDPDFPNSNSYGNTFCYLGSTAADAFDWHVHTTATADAGRAYLGNNSLHWGLHPGAASADTTRLKQLDAVRTNLPVNLGWNGVTSELSFKHQVALSNSDYTSGNFGEAVDRGVVQIQLASSAGVGQGIWQKIQPYANVYDVMGQDQFTNCTFDPTDDGNDEDDYFEPTHPQRRWGPSSTCAPEFGFSGMGATFWNVAYAPADIHHASDGPGLAGALGPGTWVESKFHLGRYRGRRLRLRFLATSIEVGNATTMQQALGWNPIEADDGWYIDDIKITNTVTSAATVGVDTADRSGLPACGPVCGSVAASLEASPPTVGPDEEVTLDASGSASDQCPGGVLHYRFWKDWNQNGLLEPGDLVLQEWGPNPVVTSMHNVDMRYVVDVRCSTRPACADQASVVVPLVCPSITPVPFEATLLFSSQVHGYWEGLSYPHRGDAIRGDLLAVRASGGQFDDTVDVCVVNNGFLEFEDATVPGPGGAFYYLVKEDGYAVLCGQHSWGTGSPAEAPGAGGDRDADLALDPRVCPRSF